MSDTVPPPFSHNSHIHPGVVTEIFPGMCSVKSLIDGGSRLCTYRRAKVKTKRDKHLEHPDKRDKKKYGDKSEITQPITRERSPVAVGDRVEHQIFGSKNGLIVERKDRKNQIARPAPGRSEEIIHVLAANIDSALLVASCLDPIFSPGLIDRFLISLQKEKIPSAIAVTKMDLCPDAQHKAPPWQVYKDIGIPVFEISTRKPEGPNWDLLLQHITEKVTVICGHSGVGKTTLLNKLYERDVGATGIVSAGTGKGRHTTSSARWLEDSAKNLTMIDTPGIREFGILGIMPEELIEYFPEFKETPCIADLCTHTDEVDCPYRQYFRFDSYLKIRKDLEDEGR